MKLLSKSLVAASAAGAMALSSATPAMARDDDGIDAGEIIAGALILGGIAAIVASAGDRDDDRYRRGYDRYDRYDRRGRDYRGGGSSRAAVERCVRIAERQAYRAGYRRADVTDIRDVDRTRRGYRVRGRIAVDEGRYRDRYRNRRSDRGYDSGNFTCRVEYGQVTDLDYSGIRGLR